MDVDPIQAAFQLLRPLCVTLLTSTAPSEGLNQNLISLHQILLSLNQELHQLFTIIESPLSTLLLRFCGSSLVGSEMSVLCTLRCFHSLVEKVDISGDTFNKTFEMILKILFKDEETKQKASQMKTHPLDYVFLSEEVLMGLITLIKLLFSHCSDPNIFATPLPTLGFCIHRLLDISVTTLNKGLQAEALRTLQVLLSKVNHPATTANFLPGFVSSLYKVITGDYKQGQDVFIEAISALTLVLSQALGDKINPMLKKKQQQTEEDMFSAFREQKKGQQQTNTSPADADVVFSEAWYSRAVTYLSPLLKSIYSVGQISTSGHRISPQFRQQWRVRLSLVESATTILSTCLYTLSTSTIYFIETIMIHVEDQWKEVSTPANNNIKQIYTILQGSSSGHSIVSSLEDNFISLLTSLPRVFHQPDDTAKHLTISLVNGYMSILPPKVIIAHMARLSAALISIVELDTTYQRIIERKVLPKLLEGTQDQGGSCSVPLEYFIYCPTIFLLFRSPEVKTAIENTCKLLCYRVDDKVGLMECFCSILKTNMPMKPECQWIINQITKQLIKQNKQTPIQKQTIIAYTQYLMDEILSADLWDNSSSVEEEVLEITQEEGMDIEGDTIPKPKTGLRPNAMNLLHSLILEGIGDLAEFSCIDFIPHLQSNLYFILCCMGSNVELICDSAWVTINRIAHYCQFCSPLVMINDHCDYIIDAIVHEMRYQKEYQKSLKVLHGILHYCKGALMFFVEDIVDDIFLGLEQNDTFTSPFLEILLGVVRGLHSTLKFEETKPQQPKKQRTKEEVLTSLFTRKLAQRKKQARREEKQKHRKTYTEQEIRSFFEEHEKKKAEMETQDQPFPIKQPSPHHSSSSDMEVESEEEPDSVYSSVKGDEVDEEGATDTSKTVTPQQSLTIKILENIQYYISHKQPNIRLTALTIVELGIEVLSHNVGKLLPMIHTLWQPLTFRFIDHDHAVLLKSLQVMKVFSRYAKEFLSKKISEDLWPTFRDKLSSYHPKNFEPTSRQQFPSAAQYHQRKIQLLSSSYQTQYSNSGTAALVTSTAFKTQLAILQCLTMLVGYTQLIIQDIRCIGATCLFYLSCHQPIQFQSQCIALFQQLIACDADYMWLLLVQLVGVTSQPQPSNLEESLFFVSVNPPTDSQWFYNFSIVGNPQHNTVDFTSNVETLLKSF